MNLPRQAAPIVRDFITNPYRQHDSTGIQASGDDCCGDRTCVSGPCACVTIFGKKVCHCGGGVCA
jgi:hypothetical protein